MSNRSDSKLKLLYIIQTFLEETDEDHPMDTQTLLSRLETAGIYCERKAVYRDIDSLIDFGFDILRSPSGKRGYFLASRTFELPEVRLLMDAVQSAGFITPKKTKILLDKLKTLISIHQAKELGKQVHIDHRVKCTNEEIYYNIDLLHKAITEEKQVQFLYKRRILGNQSIMPQEKEFTVSPYAMLWENDHYYLVCNHGKYDNLMNLRIDRMKKVEQIEEFARDFREVSNYKSFFDAADYAQKLFHMFSGNTQVVDLHCDNSLLEEILDRFGEHTPVRLIDEHTFSAKIHAAISEGLVSWIMQYGDKMTIRAPETLKNMYLDRLHSMFENYA